MDPNSPPALLQRAQAAIARRDFADAETCFTSLLAHFQGMTAGSDKPNLAMALLSRSTCRLELKKLAGALEDAEAALKEGNVNTPQEIIPGCHSTRAAAAARAAQIHEMQGDKAKSEMFKHMYSTIMQQTASSIQQAQTLKDAGNVLFKEGDFLGALDKYQEALELHSTEHTILSNACQAALKLGDLQKAKYMAEMCVSVKPDWSKGWYRKGMVEMKSKMYMEAMRAFQTGLSVAPNDADLQKMYAEATRLAEKATPGMGGMDKQFAGMMMDLQHNSWDVRGWYQENQDVAEQVDLSFLETVTKVPLDVTAALRTRHALIPEGQFPIQTEVIYQSRAADLPHGIARYVTPSDPLLSAIIIKRLLVAAFPKTSWTIAWTFKAPAADFVSWRHLHPFVAQHHTYVWLVDRDSLQIVDFLAQWESQMCLAAPKGQAVDPDAAYDGLQIVMDVPDTATVMYTSDDEAKYVAFLKSLYAPPPSQSQSQTPSGVDSAVSTPDMSDTGVRQRKAAAAAAAKTEPKAKSPLSKETTVETAKKDTDAKNPLIVDVLFGLLFLVAMLMCLIGMGIVDAAWLTAPFRPQS